MAQRSIAPVKYFWNSLRFLLVLVVLSGAIHRFVSGGKCNQAWAFLSVSIGTVADLVLTWSQPFQAALMMSTSDQQVCLSLQIQMPILGHSRSVQCLIRACTIPAIIYLS
jgi:hypothetical protein